MRVVYVNGEFLAENSAKISVFDRGFLFADAVYEVTAVVGGKLLDFDAHMKRLVRSLVQLGIDCPMTGQELLSISRHLVEINNLQEGVIYTQISRGVADRDFLISNTMKPSVILFTQEKNLIENPIAKRGIKVVTTEDKRWGLNDIKTVQLLYASLAKTRAVQQGADDAWFVKDGFVTEGSSNNAFIVTKKGVVITRPLSQDILHGITRYSVIECLSQLGGRLEERPFTVEEAEEAEEAFVTSASGFVMPVVAINGRQLGKGQPGPFCRKLREIYIAKSLETAI